MMENRKFFLLIVVIVSLIASDCRTSSTINVTDDSDGITGYEFSDYPDYKDRMPLDLYRGINVGNALDAPREGDWGWKLEESHFNVIRDAGFDHVRIPVRWSAHALDSPPYTIEKSFFERVDWAINHVLDRGMVAIVNIHHYEELFDNPARHKKRFLELWRQISVHFKDYSEHLYFEILNEPRKKLAPELWNEYLIEAYRRIRETNPDRYVAIDTALWGSYEALEYLEIPENDPHIIVTFHMYEPWDFCFQGVTWIVNPPPKGIRWRGSPTEQKYIIDILDYVTEWSRQHNNVAIWNGEYGLQKWTDTRSKVLWIRFVTRECEKRGIANTLWNFHISDGPGIYDPVKGQWTEQVLNAMMRN